MAPCTLQPIDHAPWCDRNHPQTDDGRSYMVRERYWLQCEEVSYPALGAALLDALAEVAAEAGTPILRTVTDDGCPIIRLCGAVRLRELERQVGALISATGRLFDRIM